MKTHEAMSPFRVDLESALVNQKYIRKMGKYKEKEMTGQTNECLTALKNREITNTLENVS